MTVTATTTRFSFAGNGNQGPHTIGFIILDATHIQVYFDKATSGAGTPITGGGYTAGTSDYLVKDVHYTVQNAGTSSNATITYIPTGFTVDSTVTYPTSSDSIVVTRNVPLTQTSDYTNNSTIDAETIEQSFDKLTQVTQQLNDGKDYSFKFSSNISGASGFDSNAEIATTLNVDKADRANKALKFDANGNIGVSTFDPDTQASNIETLAEQAENAANNANFSAISANASEADAEAAAQQAQAAASSLNLPTITSGDEGYYLRVKSDLSGYEFIAPTSNNATFYGLKIEGSTLKLDKSVVGQSDSFNVNDYKNYIIGSLGLTMAVNSSGHLILTFP